MSACERCGGQCCKVIKIFIGKEIDADVAEWLDMHGEYTEGYIILPAPCKHLVDGKCGIYKNRPKICRDYKVYGDRCKKIRKIKEQDGNEKESRD